MWPQQFTIFETFTWKIHHLLVLNSIKQSSEGMAFSDFKEVGCAPPTRVYRILKNLEEEGYITAQTKPQSSGRPKQLFVLTPTGIQKLQELKESLKQILDGIHARFPENNQNFNIAEFLEKGTFQHLRTPVEYILQKNSIPTDTKKAILTEMEQLLKSEIEKIHTALRKLEVSK